jgi:hypothetical protein
LTEGWKIRAKNREEGTLLECGLVEERVVQTALAIQSRIEHPFYVDSGL